MGCKVVDPACTVILSDLGIPAGPVFYIDNSVSFVEHNANIPPKGRALKLMYAENSSVWKYIKEFERKTVILTIHNWMKHDCTWPVYFIVLRGNKDICTVGECRLSYREYQVRGQVNEVIQGSSIRSFRSQHWNLSATPPLFPSLFSLSASTQIHMF